MAATAPIQNTPPTSCDVAVVQAWIDTLPKLNLDEHSTHILRFLTFANHQTISRQQRYELMELLNSEVQHITERSCQQCVQICFPMAPDKLNIYQQVQQLLEESFRGYRQIAYETSQADESPDSARHLLCGSLLRAIEILSERILMAYAMYRSPPAGTWRELHELYRYAEQKNMLTERVEHVADWLIGDAYFCTVLSALIEPYNLMRNEIYKVHQRLLKWSKALKVIHPDELDSGQFSASAAEAFVIDYERDAAALYGYQDIEAESAAQRLRLLDMAEVKRIIEAEIKKLTVKEDVSFSEWQERDLLRRMRNHLSRRNKRGSGRTPECSAVRIIAGISGSHYYMTGQVDFLPEDDELELHGDSIQVKESLSLMPLEEESWREGETRQKLESGVIKPRAFGFDYEDHENDIWKKGEQVSMRSKSQLEQSMDRRAAASAGTLQSKDHSTGGIGFICPADAGIHLHVGELLTVQNDDDSYQLGTIRWLRTMPNGELDVGCQLMANSAKPIAIRGIEGQGSKINYQRAMLLDDGSVIAPAGLYMPGSTFICNTGEALLPYKITRLLSSTNSYTHFSVEQLEESVENKSKIVASFYALLSKQG